MNKYSSFLLACFTFFMMTLWGQAPLYELSLSNKIQNAPTILEGRVVGKKAFWNQGHNLIHTAYTIEVYKVLKGELRSEKIEIIAEGGRIGYEMHVADPGVKLEIGEVGLFFCKDARVKHKSRDNITQLMTYGGVQGVIHYDETHAQAADVFQRYNNIDVQIYQAIAKEVAHSYREFKAYSIRDRQNLSQNRATPTFTSFTPTSVTAGTDSMITIVGNNFDVYDGGTNSLVYFANANDGGGTFIAAASHHIVSWINTQIEVLVPSGASTGAIGVQNTTSELGFTGSNLSVTYNLSNANNQYRVRLQDDNGTGGYDMIYSTSTTNNGVDFSTSAAVAPFNRALGTWNCESLYNAEATGATTASNAIAANTAPNIIMFDDDATPLASGTLGVCYSGYGTCDGTTWFVNGYDIVFKRSGTDGVTWNFGPAATSGGNYDFETVALHELGHSHGIGHINASGSVMHYALSNNFDARTLDPTRDVAAGVNIIDLSKPMATCAGSVTGTTDFPCVLPVSIGLSAKHQESFNQLSWEIPNPSVWRSQTLEKYDPENQVYRNLQSLEVGENCTSLCAYDERDFFLKGESSRYRLALIDLNGRTQYSEIVQVGHPNIAEDLRWTFEANEDRLLCFFSFEESAGTRIELIDMHGQKVLINFEKNAIGQWSANTSALSNGVYILKASDPMSRSRLIKKIQILR